jgi:hypothetical protein
MSKAATEPKKPNASSGPVMTPADCGIGNPLPSFGRPNGGNRRGRGFVGRSLKRWRGFAFLNPFQLRGLNEELRGTYSGRKAREVMPR